MMAAFWIVLDPGSADGAAVMSVALLTIWIVVDDLRHLTLPDGAAAGLLALALAGGMAEPIAFGLPVWPELALVLADAALAGIALWAVREGFFRRRGFDGLGLGDVKLGAAGAGLVGLGGFSLALGGASLAGIGWIVLRGGDVRSRKIPFGVLLAPAILAIFAGRHIPAAGLFLGGAP